MTNEELIAEARRWPNPNGGEPSAAPADLIGRLADALEAATGEPEWEYGVLYPWHEGVLEHSVEFDSKAEALKRLDASQDMLVRRRKAGAWEPVGGDDA